MSQHTKTKPRSAWKIILIVLGVMLAIGMAIRAVQTFRGRDIEFAVYRAEMPGGFVVRNTGSEPFAVTAVEVNEHYRFRGRFVVEPGSQRVYGRGMLTNGFGETMPRQPIRKVTVTVNADGGQKTRTFSPPPMLPASR
jgi:hypothetical protein